MGMSSISLYFLTFSKQVAKLHKEIQAFQQERQSETERFEAYKNEEMKKLRAEKRAFDKYQKASKAFPNKKEREELRELRDEVGVIGSFLSVSWIPLRDISRNRNS